MCNLPKSRERKKNMKTYHNIKVDHNSDCWGELGAAFGLRYSRLMMTSW